MHMSERGEVNTEVTRDARVMYDDDDDNDTKARQSNDEEDRMG